jgi:hypothetical protein
MSPFIFQNRGWLGDQQATSFRLSDLAEGLPVIDDLPANRSLAEGRHSIFIPSEDEVPKRSSLTSDHPLPALCSRRGSEAGTIFLHSAFSPHEERVGGRSMSFFIYIALFVAACGFGWWAKNEEKRP